MLVSRRILFRATLSSLALAGVAASVACAPSAAPDPSSTTSASTLPSAKPGAPTIVFIHGAFADASGWDDEIDALSDLGYTVYAPPNPLRGLTSDSDYVRSFLQTISGPIVLVGHSYGGAVITNAARGVSNVTALVYISAFALAEGESAASASDPKTYPGALLGPDTLTMRPVQNPAAGGDDMDLYVTVSDFREVFAADQTAERARQLGIAQRPLSAFAFTEASGAPAWQDLPVWTLISDQDKAIPPAAQEVMATRAGATITRVDSAHDSLISHPDVVVKIVLDAVAATS